MTPSEELRAAATRLRELAEVATEGPWRPDGFCVWTSEPVMGRRTEAVVHDGDEGDGGALTLSDAHWIAAMSPAVAEPLAKLLEDHAGMFELYEDHGWAKEKVMQAVGLSDLSARALARLILEAKP